MLSSFIRNANWAFNHNIWLALRLDNLIAGLIMAYYYCDALLNWQIWVDKIWRNSFSKSGECQKGISYILANRKMCIFEKLANFFSRRVKTKIWQTMICQPQSLFFSLIKVSPQFLIKGISSLKPLILRIYRQSPIFSLVTKNTF